MATSAQRALFDNLGRDEDLALAVDAAVQANRQDGFRENPVTLGVRADAWGIKRMKTKWGSCNPTARRIWLNLELAKKPEICLHYLVCHELAHLIEPTHHERFVALMDRAMPLWRAHRKTLNTSPLAHETWEY